MNEQTTPEEVKEMVENGASADEVRERMFGPQVDLCDELEACKVTGEFGTYIKHPLYNAVMHMDALNHQANEILRRKREMVAEYEAEENWDAIIFVCYERPWRIQAIQQYADRMSDAEFWEAVGHAWQDSENIWEAEDDWLDLLDCGRPEQSRMMEDEEREKLALMPEEFRVYRGFYMRSRQEALSWTVNRSKAEWFAQRLLPPGAVPRVAEGLVRRDNVIAYFDGRGEEEIVVQPDNVVIEKVHTVRG